MPLSQETSSKKTKKMTREGVEQGKGASEEEIVRGVGEKIPPPIDGGIPRNFGRSDLSVT